MARPPLILLGKPVSTKPFLQQLQEKMVEIKEQRDAVAAAVAAAKNAGG